MNKKIYLSNHGARGGDWFGKAKKGENVSASSGGKIIYAGNEIPGYGNLVLIKHSDNFESPELMGDK